MRYFVIRGFGKKKDSAGTEVDFDLVDHELIAPSLERCNFDGGTTGQIDDAGSIHEDMFALILEADVVVCDITVHNVNVFYELGVRHALRKKRTVLIKGEPSADKTPFDIGGFRYLPYDANKPADAIAALESAIRSSLRGERSTDSPVFQALPALQEAPSDAAVPIDFTNEVKRAEAAKDKGWLLMLGEDLNNLRFERTGLRQVAFAQFKLQDFETARSNFERLLAMGDQDVRILFALGNIYERLFRRSGKAEYFERSQQAIDAALQRSELKLRDRAEALSQRGRNLKTLWRSGFERLDTVEERRAKACKRQLLECHDAYREAFRVDLNSFYSGIACLQVGHVLLSLSAEPRWSAMYKSAREAQRAREALQDELPPLAQVVAAAIDRALEHGVGDDVKWAAVSEADLRFLVDDETMLQADPSGLVAHYEDALAGREPFFRGAAIGQLELFAGLGVRFGIASAVIEALKRGAPAIEAPPVRPHLVVFAGHSIDAPNRPPRFPPSSEPRARELIREHINALKVIHPAIVVLASAAPGADILLHEVCAELQVPTVLCLPMPVEQVSALSFGSLDSWRNRLQALSAKHRDNARILQDGPELPRWLDPNRTELWERGNRWMIRSAQAWDCDGRTLLALWDKDENNLTTGGTAHLVRLARQAGNFEMKIIDSRELLGV